MKLCSVSFFHTKTGRKCKKQSCVETKPEFYVCTNRLFWKFKMAFWPFISEYIFLPMQGSKDVHYFFIIFHFRLLFANTLFHVRRPFVLWSFTLLICRVVYQWSGPHMKPCFTDDTPPRATCKKTFYICITNLVFAEQKLVMVSRETKEACKTVNVTGVTSVNDAKLTLSHL